MAKKNKDDGIVALEIAEFKSKIAEFQKYLRDNSILNDSVEDNVRFKEIEIQLKMMAALPSLIAGLKQLTEKESDKQISTEGDVKINKAFQLMKEDSAE